MHIKLIAFNARYSHSCLALFYVRNEIEEHISGYRPEIIQFTINDPYYSTLLRSIEDEPYALFFSVYIWNGHYIHRMIRDLQKILPQTLIILGGPQAPHIFERVRPSDSVIQENCTIVRGEIEDVPDSFYEDLKKGHLKAQYICGRSETFSFPYRQTDFREALKDRYVYYETSRGCPFSCTYCLSSVQHGVQYKNFRQVREELGKILKQKPKIIRFVDRSFNDRPDRALAIWRILTEQEGDTSFHFEIVPDRFTDEMFSFLETIRPGRFQFEIGIQSTNPETLAAVRRRMDLKKARHNITRLAAMNTIHLHVDLIMGLPFETAEKFTHSFNDVFSMEPHFIQMGLLKILPGTAISRSVDAFGMHVCSNPPYEILANRWLDHTALGELYWFGKCVEAFYNNRFFRTIWAYIRRSGEDGHDFFRSLLGTCRRHNFFHRASTQEHMSLMLLKLASQRSDQGILRELLVFDWLRSGHRYLPEHLQIEPLHETKKKLRRRLPQNRQGVYDYRSRDAFFKQSIFAYFSRKAIRETGLDTNAKAGYVCFLPQEQPGVLNHKQTLFFPDELS